MVRLYLARREKPFFRFADVSRVERDISQAQVRKYFTTTQLDGFAIDDLGFGQIELVAQSQNIRSRIPRAFHGREGGFGRLHALVLIQKNFGLQDIELWIRGIQTDSLIQLAQGPIIGDARCRTAPYNNGAWLP